MMAVMMMMMMMMMMMKMMMLIISNNIIGYFFVISRIIKVSVSVISLGHKCQTLALIILDIAIPQVRESETILDSELQAVDSGFQFLSEELGFWIPIVSGIPESKAQEFGFHKQIFSDSEFHKQNFLDSGIRNPPINVKPVGGGGGRQGMGWGFHCLFWPWGRAFD